MNFHKRKEKLIFITVFSNMIEELGNSPNETNWTFVKTTDNVNLHINYLLRVKQENTCARGSFLKKRFWHRCFPVIFVKFLSTIFLWNTSVGCFCLYDDAFPKQSIKLKQTSRQKRNISKSRTCENDKNYITTITKSFFNC